MKAPQQMQAAPSCSLTPTRQGMLQRKCACGRRPGPSGDCTACRRQQGLDSQAGGFAAAKTALSQTSPNLVEVELSPHSASDSQLLAMASIYKQGRTPVLEDNGRLTTLDIQPAGAPETGRQLENIQRRFGRQGIAETIRGLTLSRGPSFTAAAMQHAPDSVAASSADMQAIDVNEENDDVQFVADTEAPEPGMVRNSDCGSAIARTVRTLLPSAGSGNPLPQAMRARLSTFSGDDLTDVRIHNDSVAHEAAEMFHARAFTIGRSIFFAANEYQPSSHLGRRLLAHEVAHAVQQRGARQPSPHHLQVGEPADVYEAEAERFAEMTHQPVTQPESSQPESFSFAHNATVARVQRVISFTRSNDSFTTNNMGVNEAAAGFRMFRTASPIFEWRADVQINGNAGDPCASFEVGPLQLVREFYNNVWWGTGSDRTHRTCELSALPIRDAETAGSTWARDSEAQGFGSCGDTQTDVGIADSPASSLHGWANPVAGRGGTSGWFNYGVAFVTYLSARDTRAGTGAAAFRAIGNVYWNTSISGSFDTTQPVGSRVTTKGGRVNRSKVIEGASGEFPSMHGGDIANDSASCSDA